MNRVKPPYKFESPYWTHDPAGKQNDKYRFGLLSFGPNGGFKEVNNSESNYYKACTLDIESIATELLKILVNKKFKVISKESFLEYVVTGRTII